MRFNPYKASQLCRHLSAEWAEPSIKCPLAKVKMLLKGTKDSSSDRCGKPYDKMKRLVTEEGVRMSDGSLRGKTEWLRRRYQVKELPCSCGELQRRFRANNTLRSPLASPRGG